VETSTVIYAIAPADGAIPELIAGQAEVLLPNTARMG